MEVYKGIGGLDLDSLKNSAAFPDNPTTTSIMRGLLEIPLNVGTDYGTRITTFIIPKVTGEYTFWVASDDYGEAYLSTDETPKNKRMIAYVHGWTNPHEYNKYSSQQSAPIFLKKGQPYYFEGLHKEASGGDNFAIAWQIPGTAEKEIITDEYFSRQPFGNWLRDLIDVIVTGPFSGTRNLPNNCGTDFDLYSTYADAIAKTNKWQHCHTGDMGLPGYSGPVGRSDGQHTCGSSCQPDVAYYVEEGNWIPIAGAREFHMVGSVDGKRIEEINIDNFNSILEDSAHKIVRRMCTECVPPYDDLYYRRYTESPPDLVWIMFRDFNHDHPSNKIGVDFDIFSTLEDALRKINAWDYCDQYDPSILKGFPAGCGPDYESRRADQWQKYDWKGNYAAGKQHTGFFIENDALDKVKFRQEWMLESEEMMLFLYPDQYGETDDLGLKVCHEPGSYGADNPDYDVPNIHNGWYDVSRCGKCNDYCRWVDTDAPEAVSCAQPSDQSAGNAWTQNFDWTYTLYETIDEYAGWYDLNGCGECNDYCRWVSWWNGQESGGNPTTRTTYGTWTWWDCAPAGTSYSEMDFVPVYYDRKNYWGDTFNYGKCEHQGLNYVQTVTADGIDPHIARVGNSVQFSCIMSGSSGGTESGHFDEFDHQKCSGEGANTPVASSREKFVGCFNDASSRALPVLISTTMSYENCAEICRSKGFHYFGRQYYEECWCGALTVDDHKYSRYGKLDPAACNYCTGSFLGVWKNCVYQILDQFDYEEEWGKHKCSHIPTQDTRKQCYIACRDQDESLANLLVCSKLKSVGMDWLAKEISQWLDSPICGNKDCHTSAHPLGSDLVQAKGTF
mmetsp:Transcript_14763/g.20910  ORF Transcript_14763/g.20910 Transcript_14763/m.20910 type:complete len:842 (-) Transcript_14763:293-2818(-)